MMDTERKVESQHCERQYLLRKFESGHPSLVGPGRPGHFSFALPYQTLKTTLNKHRTPRTASQKIALVAVGKPHLSLSRAQTPPS